MPEKPCRDWNPDQPFLLPPSLQEWLPEDHPVYMMLDILEELDVSAIDRKYQEKDARGTRPYAPKMMVGLLLYGYSVGIRSSRKLEKATYEDIPFRAGRREITRTIRGSRSFAASTSMSWRTCSCRSSRFASGWDW